MTTEELHIKARRNGMSTIADLTRQLHRMRVDMAAKDVVIDRYREQINVATAKMTELRERLERLEKKLAGHSAFHGDSTSNPFPDLFGDIFGGGK